MTNNEFQSGYVTFEQGYIVLSQLDSLGKSAWDDGNITWSRGEKRWRDVGENTRFSELFEDKRLNDGAVEGFAMEANLWRYSHNDGMLEELVIEREDDRFFYQKWTLHQNGKKDEKNNCFWKSVRVRLRSDLNLFNSNHMECVEVVHPEHRLHAFLTGGEVRR